MAKVYLDFLQNYPQDKLFSLAYSLGRRLIDFLGKEKFCLLLDSEVLRYPTPSNHNCIFDKGYELHNAAIALEGFLEKVIKGRKLRVNKDDSIGRVFGKNDEIVRQKIKDKRLIAKVKTVWDFCRNDIMHYSQSRYRSYILSSKNWELYADIIETIKLLYEDFYGKSLPDEGINKGFSKYYGAKNRKHNI